MKVQAAIVRADAMFTTPESTSLPSVEDRFRYKKVGGSSDTKNTADEFN